MKKKIEYVVFINGAEVGRYDNEAYAVARVDSYDGNNDIWFEEEEVEVDE